MLDLHQLASMSFARRARVIRAISVPSHDFSLLQCHAGKSALNVSITGRNGAAFRGERGMLFSAQVILW
ncbi:hypothetical protein [Candidatus Methanoperedens sp. BLZ2]|uniref:hypothetical protein n=1 Tax=Candidatus Methanoperedens sp. BLZ2 TaxID=2035255 RepID=UPI000BE47CB2|nr:hypothetical protein [Candidatus Methanoperedens sp. BLZ2]